MLRFHGYAHSGVEEWWTPKRGPRVLAAAGWALLASARPPSAGIRPLMPNIRQQEKRVRSAARQRLENLRYRSTVKTLTKRLETAVAEGDSERIAAEHLELVRTIDKAAARGALHKNTAARKKAQAARLASHA